MSEEEATLEGQMSDELKEAISELIQRVRHHLPIEDADNIDKD